MDKATLARLVQEARIGNRMIAQGKKNSRDHHAAWRAGDSWDEQMQAASSTTAGLRTIAKTWAAGRAAFLATAQEKGINPATAATQWSQGRK